MARILVIDDEQPIRRLLRRILEPAGHEVTEAEDGQRAYQMFTEEPADLVITDIFMPEMDGIEFMLRVRERYPGIPVIALSGGGVLDRDNVLATARNLGAAGILKKPFTADDCLEVVDRALEKDK